MTPRENIASFRSFILRVANRCNIDCDCCYVFNSADQAWRRLPVRMSVDVARAAGQRIGERTAAHDPRHVHVVLHGGEPLLAGPQHMADLLSAVREGIPVGVETRFELQTNGTLLMKPWLDLFERHEVVVGVSIDGPPTATVRGGYLPSSTWPTTRSRPRLPGHRSSLR
jgi:sulfatase maturation enzyme AslB (radical SAM superfamily)